jgi:hypothetical protein
MTIVSISTLTIYSDARYLSQYPNLLPLNPNDHPCSTAISRRLVGGATSQARSAQEYLRYAEANALYCLPTEILLEVIQCLHGAGVLCLARTCKKIYLVNTKTLFHANELREYGRGEMALIGRDGDWVLMAFKKVELAGKNMKKESVSRRNRPSAEEKEEERPRAISHQLGHKIPYYRAV